jgi:1,4-dihydroxy-2-naphthoyl-CoA hydrolase
MIWFNKSLAIEDIDFGRHYMGEHLEIHFSELGDNYIKATMPVNDKTKQPYGLLHGGASAALAETLGSAASALVIDLSKWICVGMEINANHIRAVKEGIVTATCSPLHLGATSHVWDIKITDEKNKLVCVSRLTVAILKKREL